VVRSRSASALAGLLAFAGVSHFVVPRFYDRIVPHALPFSPRAWTYASGVAEVATAIMVARPTTRRMGALIAAVLFVVVFPANVQMAVDYRDRGMADKAVAFGRLPLQIPLVIWALRVRRSVNPR